MSEQTEDEDSGAAFPVLQQEDAHGNVRAWFERGMTLRDYFAAKALPAILCSFDDAASRRLLKDSGQNLQEVAAQAAYMQADAMLKARQS